MLGESCGEERGGGGLEGWLLEKDGGEERVVDSWIHAHVASDTTSPLQAS